MSDNIELVIKIPEEAHKLLKNEGVDWLGAEHILNAVANGIPLPKGHGRLIDADAFGEELHRYTEAPYSYALNQFENAQTILEADAESEDENRDKKVMTREEAIKILKENLCSMCAYGSQNMISCDIRGCDNRDAIKIIERSLCDSCTNRGCIFQSGIIRSHCDFYKAESEE